VMRGVVLVTNRRGSWAIGVCLRAGARGQF
jgi:hypothetical protein